MIPEVSPGPWLRRARRGARVAPFGVVQLGPPERGEVLVLFDVPEGERLGYDLAPWPGTLLAAAWYTLKRRPEGVLLGATLHLDADWTLLRGQPPDAARRWGLLLDRRWARLFADRGLRVRRGPPTAPRRRRS